MNCYQLNRAECITRETKPWQLIRMYMNLPRVCLDRVQIDIWIDKCTGEIAK